MRVLIIADGEGISQIVDHRECWPAFPQYWRTGRTKFTADVSAAASGLLDGGADEVIVLDGHGLEWHNVLAEGLPKRARLIGKNESSEDFDFWFNVGAHARCGTANGFISHTNVPYFRVAINGHLVTEAHESALDTGGVPLGVTGDAALDSQLDGFLQGVPFLPTKRSTSRAETIALHSGSERSTAAISSFAKECLIARKGSRRIGVPKVFRASFSFDRKLVPELEGKKGLVRSSPSVLTVSGKGWKNGVSESCEAAQMVAVKPYLEAQGGLDLSSEELMQRQKRTQLLRVRRYLTQWVSANPKAWED